MTMAAVVYWMGNLICLQQGVLEKHPSVCVADSRKDLTATFAFLSSGEGWRYHSQGALLSVGSLVIRKPAVLTALQVHAHHQGRCFPYYTSRWMLWPKA